MSDATPATPERGFFENLIDLFVAPRDAFAALLKRPGFWLPIAISVALAVGFTALWLQKVDPAEFMRNQLVESGQWDKMPAETRTQVIETQSKMFPIFGWVIALIGNPIGVLIVGAVLLFVFRFFYAGEVTFKQALTITAYSFLAYGLVTTPLLLLIFFLKADWNLNPSEILQANATLLLDKAAVAKPLWVFLGGLDLLSFWLMFLLASGFGVAVKRTTVAAFWGVAIPWALILAIKVVFALF